MIFRVLNRIPSAFLLNSAVILNYAGFKLIPPAILDWRYNMRSLLSGYTLIEWDLICNIIWRCCVFLVLLISWRHWNLLLIYSWNHLPHISANLIILMPVYPALVRRVYLPVHVSNLIRHIKSLSVR